MVDQLTQLQRMHLINIFTRELAQYNMSSALKVLCDEEDRKEIQSANSIHYSGLLK